VYCDQTVERIKMKLDRRVGLGPSHIVLDGNPAPLPPKGRSPQFSAHVCCRKVAGWTKMPLGIEVDLGHGHIVLDGDPAFIPKKEAQTQLPSQKRGHSPPIFGRCLLWRNGRPSQLLLSTCYLHYETW